MASRFHDLEFQVADLRVRAWPPRAPIADVIVVVVVVMVMVDEVVYGGDALFASVALPICGAVWVNLFPALTLPVIVQAYCPPFHLPEDVADVLEQLLVAATWLREAGNCAVVGEITGPLLLHQLVLPLLCFRKLCCYHNQAQVNHEEGTNLEKTQGKELAN